MQLLRQLHPPTKGSEWARVQGARSAAPCALPVWGDETRDPRQGHYRHCHGRLRYETPGMAGASWHDAVVVVRTQAVLQSCPLCNTIVSCLQDWVNVNGSLIDSHRRHSVPCPYHAAELPGEVFSTRTLPSHVRLVDAEMQCSNAYWSYIVIG